MKSLLVMNLLLTATAAALLAAVAASGDSRAQPSAPPFAPGDAPRTPAMRVVGPVGTVGTGAMAASVPLPSLRGVYRAPRLVLAGTVPDESERRALVARARALYGASHVVDHLEVGPVANPVWLSPAFLPDLRGVRHATMLLEDGRLVVDGDAGSAQTLAVVAASLERLRGQGLEVDNRLRGPAR